MHGANDGPGAVVAGRNDHESSEGCMLKEGDKAPEVTGVSYDGSSFDLGAPGKRTVLFFYPKANTGG
jgi:peroxiredoxin